MIKFDDGELKDILPSNFTRQPQVVAISYALKQEYDRYLLCLVRAYVYASIDTAEDDVLDYLATDLHVRYYRTDYSLEVKRKLIKSAIAVMSKDGTKYAVDTVIQTSFGDGESIEWFNYDGDPGHFRIRLDNGNGYDIEDLLAVLKVVKRESAHLDKIGLQTDVDQDIYFGLITQTGVSVTGESDTPTVLILGIYDTGEFDGCRML